mmetsp:Transcript_55989/g.126325  ORF Transcript_55989/g.126325 Transcript_55989/m.126325 type:complete len:245 (-) Transcript_55989:804-1538(-)
MEALSRPPVQSSSSSMAESKMLLPASCRSSIVLLISVSSLEGKLVLSVNRSGISRPRPSFSDRKAAQSAQAYTSARVAEGRNFRWMRCPAGKRNDSRAFPSAGSAPNSTAFCRRRSWTSFLNASCLSSSSRSKRACSSAWRSASRCSCAKSCCCSSRFLSISRASWYSLSCCSRRCLSSACCSRRATISEWCDSISSKQAVRSPTAASACISPCKAPMTRISSALAGNSTQKQGNWRAWTICAT